jgi:glutaredoxin
VSLTSVSVYLWTMEWRAAFWRWASTTETRRRLLWVALFLSLLLLLLQRGPAWFFDPRRGNAFDHVIVYSTSWCPACERLRQCLRRHGVPFEERDVETSWRAAAEWSALDGDGVPLTLVGQRVAYGMRQEELETALGGGGFRVDCWGAGAVIDLRGSSLRSAKQTTGARR